MSGINLEDLCLHFHNQKILRMLNLRQLVSKFDHKDLWSYISPTLLITISNARDPLLTSFDDHHFFSDRSKLEMNSEKRLAPYDNPQHPLYHFFKKLPPITKAIRGGHSTFELPLYSTSDKILTTLEGLLHSDA